MNIYEQMLANTLDMYSEKLKTGACNMSNDQLMNIMETMSQQDMTQKLSKDQACSLLGMSRSSFDDKVRYGLIPRGQKVRGFKELMWNKGEIMILKEELCQQKPGEIQQ